MPHAYMPHMHAGHHGVVHVDASNLLVLQKAFNCLYWVFTGDDVIILGITSTGHHGGVTRRAVTQVTSAGAGVGS
jgi:hypothetical protein